LAGCFVVAGDRLKGREDIATTSHLRQRIGKMSEANWLSLTLREGLRKLWEWKERHKKVGKVEKQQAVVNICVARKGEMTSPPCTTTRDSHLPPLSFRLG